MKNTLACGHKSPSKFEWPALGGRSPAIALSALLQVAVVNFDFLNLAFGTVPLTPGQWLLCAGMASLVLWASELRKLLARARGC